MFLIPKPTVDFSILHTDIHSHLIPGIDDGSKSVEDSLSMIRALSNLGYKRLVTTPHIRNDYFPNTRKIILEGFEVLKKALQATDIPVQLEAAAEYYIDEHFEQLLERDELLTINDRFVLIEMSFHAPSPRISDVIFRLQTKGYQPILAHPERYLYFKNNLKPLLEIKERGCLFQMNILSLMGHYGPEIKKMARQLLQKELIDFLGSDLHRLYQVEEIEKNMSSKSMQRLLRKSFLNKTL